MKKRRFNKIAMMLFVGLCLLLAIRLSPPFSPFEENYESLAYGDPIMLIKCQIESPYGIEITYPVCHSETKPNHVTYCLFLGRGVDPGECAHVFF